MPVSRFARGSFRPESFCSGSIHQWVILPQFHGSFCPYFYPQIEVKYVLVYKGVERGGGVVWGRCAFGYSSGLFIQYQLLMSFIL